MSFLVLISSAVGRWRYMIAAPWSSFEDRSSFLPSSFPNTVFCILEINGVTLHTKSRMQLVSSSVPCCLINSSIVSGRDSFLAAAIKSWRFLEFLFRIHVVGSSDLYGLPGRRGPDKNVDI